MSETTNCFFNIGEKVVCSSHGVGEIKSIESNTYAGSEIKFYVIQLINQKMLIKVPVNQINRSGLRHLTNEKNIDGVYEILKKKSGNSLHKSKSKKLTDYKQKLNSGNINDWAEVVRDLYKSDCLNTSYSQKTIYESALNRLADELGLLTNINSEQMLINLEQILMAKI